MAIDTYEKAEKKLSKIYKKQIQLTRDYLNQQAPSSKVNLHKKPEKRGGPLDTISSSLMIAGTALIANNFGLFDLNEPIQHFMANPHMEALSSSAKFLSAIGVSLLGIKEIKKAGKEIDEPSSQEIKKYQKDLAEVGIGFDFEENPNKKYQMGYKYDNIEFNPYISDQTRFEFALNNMLDGKKPYDFSNEQKSIIDFKTEAKLKGESIKEKTKYKSQVFKNS